MCFQPSESESCGAEGDTSGVQYHTMQKDKVTQGSKLLAVPVLMSDWNLGGLLKRSGALVRTIKET